MAIPLLQMYKVARYIAGRKLRGDKRYPLVLMLEPLFQCNLACSGCGKIDYPKEILQKRVGLEDALRAVDECGAPIVSIPGGEPLIHKEMPQIVARFSEVKTQTKDKPKPEAAQIQQAAAAEYGKVQEIGGLVGRFLLAILAVRILSRRALLRVFQIPGLILMPLIFWGFATQENWRLFQIGSWEVTWMQLGTRAGGEVVSSDAY